LFALLAVLAIERLAGQPGRVTQREQDTSKGSSAREGEQQDSRVAKGAFTY